MTCMDNDKWLGKLNRRNERVWRDLGDVNLRLIGLKSYTT